MVSLRTSTLTLERWHMHVTIGVSPEERARPQALECSLSLRWKEIPKGHYTDNVQHVACYAAIVTACQHFMTEGEWHLLEHLAHALLVHLERSLPYEADVTLSLSKLHPPIDGFDGTASITLEATLCPMRS